MILQLFSDNRVWMGGSTITKYLITEAAECLARLNLKVTVQWAEVVQLLTKSWGQCGNEHSTRLKKIMLSIIQLWNHCEPLSVGNIGKYLDHRLTALSKYLGAEEHLFSYGSKLSSYSSMFKVVLSFIKLVYNVVVKKTKGLAVGLVSQKIAKVAELLGAKFRLVINKLLQFVCLDSSQAMVILTGSFHLLTQLALFASDGYKNYSFIGLRTIAITVLAQISLTIIPTLIGERSERRWNLRHLLNNTVSLLMKTMNILKGSRDFNSLSTIIVQEYGEELKSIGNNTSKAGLHCLSNSKLKMITGLLQSSQKTGDEKTLV